MENSWSIAINFSYMDGKKKKKQTTVNWKLLAGNLVDFREVGLPLW